MTEERILGSMIRSYNGGSSLACMLVVAKSAAEPSQLRLGRDCMHVLPIKIVVLLSFSAAI